MADPEKEKMDPDLAETILPSEHEDDTNDTDMSVFATALYSQQGQTVNSGEVPKDLPSQVIPGFEIQDELGRGAFGVVYRVRDLKLDRSVAVKLPLLTDPKLSEKYVQEARNAARIDAQGIVPVFQVGTTDQGQPFVVQKLIDGTDLRSMVKKHGKLPIGLALQYIYKISLAMATAHEAGLVHRDLKPANILIDQNDEPWVADFGLAVFEDDQRMLRGEVAGTPTYMSPEQLMGRADWLDGRTDIWSIGIIMYELLTGRPPFESKEFGELKEQILNRSPRPLSQRLASAPTDLDELFGRCCAKDVNERFANATELATALQQFMMAHPSLPVADMSMSTSLDTSMTFGTRRMAASTVWGNTFVGQTTVSSGKDKSTLWLSIAVLGVALVSIGGLVTIWMRMGPTEDSPEPNPTPPIASSSQQNDPTVETRLPIRVSKAGNGTHESIAAAIAAAEPDEEIVVEAGVYRESLEIDKSVRLLGEGARDEVRLVGDNSSSLVISGGSSLELVNLSVDADGQDLNTIEVVDGFLSLNGCRVTTSSYDCVKVHPNSRLKALGCLFQSAEHPAIVAKQAAALNVSECDFRFDLPSIGVDRSEPILGIELTECGGTIQGCNFTGVDQLGKGISCRDAMQKIRVIDCTFTGLLHGIELFGCQDVELISENVLSDCQLAVVAEASQLNLEGLESKGCDYGVSLLQGSNLIASNTICDDNRRVGIWLENSSAKLEQCFVRGNDVVGILVDNETVDSTLVAEACTIQENQIGLLLVGGKVELESGLISLNNSAGIAILSYEQLPEALRRRQQSNESQRELFAKYVKINGKKDAPAVLFNAVGSYQLDECPFVDFANSNRPAMSPGLTTEIRDGVTFVVSREQ